MIIFVIIVFLFFLISTAFEFWGSKPDFYDIITSVLLSLIATIFVSGIVSGVIISIKVIIKAYF